MIKNQANSFYKFLFHNFIQHADQLVDFLFPLFVRGRRLDAAFQMRAQNLPVCPVQNRLGGHELLGNLDTVAVLLHHTENPVKLSPCRFYQSVDLGLICLRKITSLYNTTPQGGIYPTTLLYHTYPRIARAIFRKCFPLLL